MATRTRREKLWVALGLLAVAMASLWRSVPGPSVVPLSPSAPTSSTKSPLLPGILVERPLPSGHLHVYRIWLRKGDFLHVVAFQQGVDVVVSLVDPSGGEVISVDSPNGAWDFESLFAVVDQTGSYSLGLRADDRAENRGHYQLRLDKPRPASGEDRLRAEAALAFARGETLRQTKSEEGFREAVREYTAALALWRRLRDREREGDTLYRLGWVRQMQGDLETARVFYLKALDQLQGRGPALPVRNRLGLVYQDLGDFKSARDSYEKVLSAGEASSSMAAVNNLGNLHLLRGEADEALRSLRQALDMSRKLKLPVDEAQALSNLANLYLALGKPSLALEKATQALQIRTRLQDGRGEAENLEQLGRALGQAGLTGTALGFFGQALDLARRTGYPALRISILNAIAGIALEGKDLDEALQALAEAQEVAEKTGDPHGRANTLANLGYLDGLLGQDEQALDHLARAEALYRGWDDRSAVASILFCRAQLQRDRGQLSAARATIEESLSLVESLRTEPKTRDLRASFLQSRRAYFELLIDILVRLHRREPTAGHDAEAFAVSERLRARTLLEELTESTAPTHEIRKRSPRYAALVKPHLATVREVQEVLEKNTCLLAYTLGDERSFLWRLDRFGLEIYDLPGRKAIELAARRAYSLLARGRPRYGGAELDRALSRLSHLLLAPLRGKLGQQRLLLVTDGVLRSVPFAALADPDSPDAAEPLVVRHSLVSLPSASIALLLRRERAGRPSPKKLIAMLADPVFRSDDSRLSGLDVPRASDRAGWGRLSYAAQEADAILSLVPPDKGLRAVGLDATRQLATSAELRDYCYIHFATHAWIDSRHPDLSGIVLSQFDRQGKRIDGLLRSYQVYDLNLPVDMVVLSACETAVEPRMGGEGLSSLTRGFLYAGAQRVAVTLWDVDDHATAILMKTFYQGLLREGMSPAEALRAAQVDLAQQKTWRSPYYWAGFVLVGEWG